MDYKLSTGILAVVAILFLTHHFFFVPRELRHLPRVPIPPLLWSYLTAEPEDKRLTRLVLPFANERKEEVVLVWALGRWMVHVLDHKLGSTIFANIEQFPKEDPPDDLLLWKLIGRNNILLSNGQQWRKHSRIVRNAINQAIPIAQFVTLARRLFAVMGEGSKIQRFDDLSQRFALDAVGTTAFGYDFDAIAHESDFVRNYNHIMHAIANPFYLLMPAMEHIIPRRGLSEGMNTLSKNFQDMLVEKRDNPGSDMLTYMVQDVEITDRELRDNMILLFIAGHDTSAGGISTLMYFLAKYPHIQERARKEVLEVLGETTDPTFENVQQMHYLMACVREGLRINTPIQYVVPRISASAVSLGRYVIPANTSIILNIHAIHHSEVNWPEPFKFDPNRFPKGFNGGAAWVPFGLGPRQCPAKAFALNEQMVLTAMLLRQYEWALPAKSRHAVAVQNAFSPFALSLPHQLDLEFTHRKSGK